jgi:hypothetical protein
MKTGKLAKLSNFANFPHKRGMIATSEQTLHAFRAITVFVAPMGLSFCRGW